MFDWSRYQRLVYIYTYMKALEERRPDIMKVNLYPYKMIEENDNVVNLSLFHKYIFYH